MALKEQLEGTRVTRKGDTSPQVPPPLLKMVAGGKHCASRSTISPTKTCSADLYRRINKRVGYSLKQTHCKGNLVFSRKQASHKLSGTKSGFYGPKRVPRPLFEQHSSGNHRQHHSGCLYKQRRGDEVGPSICPSMENPDLVYQETGNSQSSTHPRPAECDSRQAIHTRPDNSNKIVPSSRGLPSNMLPVAPAPSGPVCHQVQHQTTTVCINGFGPPGLGSRCAQSVLGRSGPICLPTSSHIWQRWTGKAHPSGPAISLLGVFIGLDSAVMLLERGIRDISRVLVLARNSVYSARSVEDAIPHVYKMGGPGSAKTEERAPLNLGLMVPVVQ